ncbi:protein-disulfide reductase DsbD family protein [Flavobacteriaceae bacterium]|jgi:thiol:disulfide interchange protein|nr:protein-disulfide reductase DsbD family protein [Flavobacteriaceae bacterium]MDC3219360.1 protein-disulfide reductase DsbD family protein [Flavobacteriaceae bacterium]
MIKNLLFTFFTLMSLNAQDTEPVSWTYELTKLNSLEYQISFNAEIIEGWKLYSQFSPEEGSVATRFKFLNNNNNYVADEIFNEEPYIIGFDNVFKMDLFYFEGKANFKQSIKLNNKDVNQIKIEVEYSSCDDELCIFRNETFNIVLDKNKKILQDDNVTLDDIKKYNSLELQLDKSNYNSVDVVQSSNYFEIFIFGLLAGFLALLTPCIFPMIPLTVSYFIDQEKLKYNSLTSASLYGFFIVMIYILLSVPFHLFDSLNPNILNTISTNVYVNITFFLVFIFFAISFFGYFDIVIPSNIISGSEKKSEKGGVIGIFFMSLTLALVSFSCTGPILGSLLAGSLSSAESGAMQLSSGMLGFGFALALPFTFLAFYPKYLSLIPKSGLWLKKLKVSLGFIELALAFKFLSNADLVEGWGILKREVFLIIWILIFLTMSLYLFGSYFGKLKLNFKSLSGWFFMFFSFYLISGLYDSKNVRFLSGILPPEFYSIEEKVNDCPLGLKCFKDFQDGKKYAIENEKIILLDFTGWACANCRRMEENVWSKPAIFNLLDNNFVIISLYVDDRTKLSIEEEFKFLNNSGNIQYVNNIGRKWSLFQQINFNNASQPYYVAMLPSGKILTEPIQFTSEENFKNWLDSSIEESKN